MQIHIYTDNEVFNLFKLCALYGALYGLYGALYGNEVFNLFKLCALYGALYGLYGALYGIVWCIVWLMV